MGIYLNPGFTSFENTVRSEIFVDKTEMLLFLNSVVSTDQRYICVSRPRRFGKSIAANMLCAYYGKPDSRELFQKCKVSQTMDWDRYLGQFDILRIVMTDFFREGREVEKSLTKLTERIVSDLDEEFPDAKYDTEDLPYSMDRFSRNSGRQIVVVIDEWDAVFRECKEDKKGQTRYLDFLRDWLKDRDYIALAYMTGILPIKKYGKHSALNMFNEYSMITPMQLAPYTGFTEEEVKNLCVEYNMDYNEISDWYDGYLVSGSIPVVMRQKQGVDMYSGQPLSIYSPLSVVRALSTGLIMNYWNKTETYEALAEYIRMNLDGLKDAVVLMMEGGSVKVDISSYQNDMTTFTCRDDVLALLINLGYLKYNLETGEVSVPNKEILDEFKISTRSEEWVDTFKAFEISAKLLEAIWSGDEEKTAELMEQAHDRTGNKTYNDEAALSYGIQYALYAAQKYYTTVQELDTGKGYADLVYLPSPKYPDKPAFLVELKYNKEESQSDSLMQNLRANSARSLLGNRKDVKTAADQIKDRNYPQILEHYAGNLLLVSINYDREAKGENFKRHSCRIEKY
ncbi:MAG: AAA family ATPase [Lachnospiraceae bacterium]|nr:AAA family ATPase [Lachnospiraceae bacterium]